MHDIRGPEGGAAPLAGEGGADVRSETGGARVNQATVITQTAGIACDSHLQEQGIQFEDCMQEKDITSSVPVIESVPESVMDEVGTHVVVSVVSQGSFIGVLKP